MTNVLFCQGVFCVEWILTRLLWTVIFITFTTTDSRIQCRECHCVRLFGAFAFYPPVAQTRFAQTVGLVAEACLHLITPYSWAFPDCFRDPVVWFISGDAQCNTEKLSSQTWYTEHSPTCFRDSVVWFMSGAAQCNAGVMQLRACYSEHSLTCFRDLLNYEKSGFLRTFHGLFIFQRGLPVPGRRRIRHLWAVLRTTHLRRLRLLWRNRYPYLLCLWC